jgi:phosphatidylglycerol:prolipoprotein diacylglycerol transferase
MTATHYWVHNIDSVIVSLGPLPIRWYGVMYLLGFGIGYWLLLYRRKRGLLQLPDANAVQDLVFYAFCGVLIGGRLGHCLFYDPRYYFSHPAEILMVWKGGMASHGGIAGVMVALYIFARQRGVSFWHLLDNIALAVTPGLGFGRIANFVNAELHGKPTDGSWGVIFPTIDQVPRHPVQLYQAATEGLLLFLILMWVGRRPVPPGRICGLFGIFYAIVRIVTEHYRAPSPLLDGPAGLGITQGQFLSLFALGIGVGVYVYSLRQWDKTPC